MEQTRKPVVTIFAIDLLLLAAGLSVALFRRRPVAYLGRTAPR